MITQAMILAAGKGTRMRPLTLTTPKPLVMVADKPLIVWHIERLAQAGIKHITLNAGYLADVLVDGLKALDLPSRLGITLNISVESGEPLETAGGIRFALDQGLLRSEPFILVNGDVWTQFDFTDLLNHDLSDHLAHLVMTSNPEHNPAGDFVLMDDGYVHAKTDQATQKTATFAGISLLSPSLLDPVQQGEIAPLAPLLKAQMPLGKVTGQMMPKDCYWADVGTLERRSDVENFIKSL